MTTLEERIYDIYSVTTKIVQAKDLMNKYQKELHFIKTELYENAKKIEEQQKVINDAEKELAALMAGIYEPANTVEVPHE